MDGRPTHRPDPTNRLDPTNLSDAELVRALSSDAWGQALATLWDRHIGLLYRVARTSAGSEQAARDALADALSTLAERAASGRLNIERSFKSYAATAVRNAVLGAWRSRGRIDLNEEPVAPGQIDGSADPGAAPIDDLEQRYVMEAFGSLPENQRQVLWLVEVEGLPPREAAVILDLSPNNVSQLARRARLALREAWIAAHLRFGTSDPACRQIGRNLPGYVMGDLATDRVAAVDEHLVRCSSCRGLVADLRDDTVKLRGLWLPVPLAVGWKSLSAQLGVEIGSAAAATSGSAAATSAGAGAAGSGAAGATATSGSAVVAGAGAGGAAATSGGAAGLIGWIGQNVALLAVVAGVASGVTVAAWFGGGGGDDGAGPVPTTSPPPVTRAGPDPTDAPPPTTDAPPPTSAATSTTSTTTTTTTTMPPPQVDEPPARIVPAGWRPGISPDAAALQYYVWGTPSPQLDDPGGPLPEGMFAAAGRWSSPDRRSLDLDLYAFRPCVVDDPRIDSCWDGMDPSDAPADFDAPVGRTSLTLDATVRVNIRGACEVVTGNGDDLIELLDALAADWQVLLDAGYEPFVWEEQSVLDPPPPGLRGEIGPSGACPPDAFDPYFEWRYQGSASILPSVYARRDRPPSEWLPGPSLIETVNGETILHIYGGFIS